MSRGLVSFRKAIIETIHVESTVLASTKAKTQTNPIWNCAVRVLSPYTYLHSASDQRKQWGKCLTRKLIVTYAARRMSPILFSREISESDFEIYTRQCANSKEPQQPAKPHKLMTTFAIHQYNHCAISGQRRPDQPAHMRRLIWACAVRILPQRQGYICTWKAQLISVIWWNLSTNVCLASKNFAKAFFFEQKSFPSICSIYLVPV